MQIQNVTLTVIDIKTQLCLELQKYHSMSYFQEKLAGNIIFIIANKTVFQMRYGPHDFKHRVTVKDAIGLC